MIYKLTYPVYDSVESLTYNATRTVYPRDGGVRYKYKREKPEHFFFRVYMEGSLVFYNNQRTGIDDFSIFSQIFEALSWTMPNTAPGGIQTLFTINVYRDCDTVNAFWTGTFTILDGVIDFQNGTFTVTPKVSDGYDALFDIADKEYNLPSIGTNTNAEGWTYSGEQSVRAEKTRFYEYKTLTAANVTIPGAGPLIGIFPTDAQGRPTYLAGDGIYGVPGSNVYLNADWEVDQCAYEYAAINVYNITTRYVREYVVTLYVAGAPTLPPSTGTGAWSAGEFIYTGNGYQLTKYHRYIESADPLEWSEQGNGITTKYYNLSWTGDLTSYDTYEHCRKLRDVLNFLVVEAGLTVESQFFFNAINPLYYYTGDLEAYSTNNLAKLMVAFRSDIKDPTATNGQSICKMTFNKLMDALVKMFNVGWYIEGTVLHIEHLVYCINYLRYTPWAVGDTGYYTDLTTEDARRLTSFGVAYEFDAEKVVDVEDYRYAEQLFPDIVGLPFYYEWATHRNDRRTEYKVEGVMTDLQYIHTFPDDVSNDGIVLLACEDYGTDYQVRTSTGLMTGIDSIPNAVLGWPALMLYYKRWGTPYYARINNTDALTYPESTALLMADELVFTSCCGDTFDPLKKLRVLVSYGTTQKTLAVEITEATYDAQTETVTAKVKYSNLQA